MKTILIIFVKIARITLAGNATLLDSVRAVVLQLILESSIQLQRTVTLWKPTTMLVETILWLSLASRIARYARTQLHARFAILIMHLMVRIYAWVRSTALLFKIVSFVQWQVDVPIALWALISRTRQLATQFVAMESKLPPKAVMMETPKMETAAAPTAP